MKRKIFAAVCVLFALALAAGCTEPSGNVSSGASSSLPSVSAESVYYSAPEESSSEVSSETSSEAFSEASSEETSSDASSDTSSGFSPWRGEDEPDLEHWKSPSIPEEGFSFPTRSLTLDLGKSVTVAYEFKPVGATNRALVWSSSDESVVTVENGRVTAVGLGKATVRAETAGGRSAECRVTVVSPGTLGAVGELISKITDGNFVGWQFALYDAELDGTLELFTRRIGTNGVPVVTAYRVQDGAQVLSKTTGDGEEWAIWRRKDGSRYLLLSYTEKTSYGSTRYVLDEVIGKNGVPVFQTAFARETAQDGTVTYYVSQTPCSQTTYDSKRKTYFSENRQLEGTVLPWTSGTNAKEIERALLSQAPLR